MKSTPPPPYRLADYELGIAAEDPRDVRFFELQPGFTANDPEDMEIEVLSFGENRVLSIDNFFLDPSATRAYAASLQFRPEDLGISGLRANVPDDQIYLTAKLENVCASLIMKHILGFEGKPVSLFTNDPRNPPCFTCSTLDREKAKRLEQTKDSVFHERLMSIGTPHVDSARPAWYNCIVHLTTPGKNPGGTGLFRHRETGLASFLMYDAAFSLRLQQAHKATFFDKMLEALRDRDETTMKETVNSMRGNLPVENWFRAEDNAEWECIGSLPGVFNRAYLFPSWQFHAEYMENDRLDTSRLENTRLTFNMFINAHAVVED